MLFQSRPRSESVRAATLRLVFDSSAARTNSGLQTDELVQAWRKAYLWVQAHGSGPALSFLAVPMLGQALSLPPERSSGKVTIRQIASWPETRRGLSKSMVMMSVARLFYVGMVNTDAYADVLDQRLFTGAATHKMMSVIGALREAGVSAWLVTMPLLGRPSKVSYSERVVLRSNGSPGLYLPTSSNRYLRKLLAFFAFGRFCAFGVRRNDTVLLYNHAFEYVLGAAILKMRGKAAFLDIEDSPRMDLRGAGFVFGRVLFQAMLRLTQAPTITVSQQIVSDLALENSLVVYGVAGRSPDDEMSAQESDQEHRWGRIHFGGTLIAETGLFLFCDAVRLLAKELRDKERKFTFVITGIGGDTEIEALSRECAGSNITIEVHRSVDRLAYLRIIRSCFASLALKLPESSISATTFPSKVVEITNEGILLITTKASDVPLLFDASNAVLIDDATPAELARKLYDIASSPETFVETAARGQERARELFSPRSVGQKIADHLNLERKAPEVRYPH